jgi:hypothetical protein
MLCYLHERILCTTLRLLLATRRGRLFDVLNRKRLQVDRHLLSRQSILRLEGRLKLAARNMRAADRMPNVVAEEAVAAFLLLLVVRFGENEVDLLERAPGGLRKEEVQDRRDDAEVRDGEDEVGVGADAGKCRWCNLDNEEIAQLSGESVN